MAEAEAQMRDAFDVESEEALSVGAYHRQLGWFQFPLALIPMETLDAVLDHVAQGPDAHRRSELQE